MALALGVAGTALWGALALHYAGPGNALARDLLAAGFLLVGLASLVGFALRRRLPGWHRGLLGAYAAAFAGVLVAWQTVTPSNDRDWRTEEAVLPYAEIEGDRITLHNVRNFDYRSETEFSVAYTTRSVDLRRLEAVDLYAVYWMGPAIAHVYLSFVFAGQAPLAISIEARKERGEGYSSVAGFFRQYELYYVVAEERDVTRVRTNYRKDPPEDVFLFRLTSKPENRRRLFLEYLRQINALRQMPEFYNTLTTNCTTAIWHKTLVNPDHLRFSWKILASGYLPEYLYEMGAFGTAIGFDELRQRSRINAAAQAADRDPEFWRRIRAGLPTIAGN